MIGLFDSGFGGLTILKAFRQNENLKKYSYLYLGDNARAPYGDKPDEALYAYACEAADFLFSRGCELIIFACNTVSSYALKKIQQEYLPHSRYADRRILGVIIPAVEKITDDIQKLSLKPKQSLKIGIIGTNSTIASQTFNKEIEKILPKQINNLRIISQPTPLLVPLIEEGWIDRRETKMVLKHYLRPLKNQHIDYLILGCTHYPLLLKQIRQIMPATCKIVNTPDTVAEKTADYLHRHPEIQTKLLIKNKIIFFTTGNPHKFKEHGERYLGTKIKNIEKINL
jgi:glutamate racemase